MNPVDNTWLQNVKAIFRPPNYTSHLQTGDTGTINNIKCHLRSLLVRRFLAKIHRKDASLTEWTFLTSSIFWQRHWITSSWKLLATASKRVAFLCVPGNTMGNEDDSGELDILDLGDLDTDMSPEEFVSVDKQLATCELCAVQDITADVTTED